MHDMCRQRVISIDHSSLALLLRQVKYQPINQNCLFKKKFIFHFLFQNFIFNARTDENRIISSSNELNNIQLVILKRYFYLFTFYGTKILHYYN
jgi:hypothetical protein